MWKLLDAIPVNTLHQIAKRSGSTDYAVRFFNNKQHPKFYRNRETLSKAIRREAANGMNGEKVEHSIVDWLYKTYIFHGEGTCLRYMNGELFYCRNVHVQKNQKHYEMQFKIKVLSDGTVQKETFFHSDMTEGEQALFTWYYDQCVGHDVYGSLHRKKEVKSFIDFLHAYWAMENRSYTYVSCDDSATNYHVMVSVDGLEDHPLRVCINPHEKRITTVHLDSLNYRNLDTLFDEEELVAFITQKAPSRMHFLY